MPHYFTVEEANALLPDLQHWMVEIVATQQRITSLRPAVASVMAKSDANSGSATASEMVLAFDRLERLLKRVERMGVEVKDVATGLCDFLALHQGREIYLCWRLGEPRVAWWHELHTGVVGRRPVQELEG